MQLQKYIIIVSTLGTRNTHLLIRWNAIKNIKGVFFP